VIFGIAAMLGEMARTKSAWSENLLSLISNQQAETKHNRRAHSVCGLRQLFPSARESRFYRCITIFNCINPYFEFVVLRAILQTNRDFLV
jgi:hypothetical protein